MKAYKGFTKELTATRGKGVFQFAIGETVRTEKSKTVASGFHCCENPFECLTYYPLGDENRYLIVEAAGDIDEDGYERIACTELTPIKELTIAEFALHGMKYMIEHPMRGNWEKRGNGVLVQKEVAEGSGNDFIVIARGDFPEAKGREGQIIGLIKEQGTGEIIDAKLFIVSKEQDGKWFTVNNRKIEEVSHEKESDRSA